MWSKPVTWIGLLISLEIGAVRLEQKAENAAVAALAVLEDVAPQQALLLEAELLQQHLGAAVAQVGARGQPAQAVGAGESDDRLHSLLGVASAPGLTAEHE